MLAEYILKLRGLVPGPHKIWLASPVLSQTIVPTGAYYQTESTLTKAEIEAAGIFHYREDFLCTYEELMR